VRINLNITAALAAAALGLLAGCASRLPEPGAADAMRASREWPGTTVGDLHRGKQRYVQACASCHGLVDPHRFPSERWPTFVKEMSGKLQLSPGDVTDLTRYLVVASQSAPAP
jgi:hypothetical protein